MAIRAACTRAGQLKRAAERLIDVTYECLMRGVAAIRPGGRLGDIGHAIQSFAEAERCSVVRDFCGHGVGRAVPRAAERAALRAGAAKARRSGPA